MTTTTDVADLVRRLRIDKKNWVDAAAADTIEAQAKQIEALKTANANHEDFERKWYLALDVIEALQADVERLDYLDSLATYKGNFMGGVHHLEFTHEFESPNISFRAAIDAGRKK
jgi:hypothetical protein